MAKGFFPSTVCAKDLASLMSFLRSLTQLEMGGELMLSFAAFWAVSGVSVVHAVERRVVRMSPVVKRFVYLILSLCLLISLILLFLFIVGVSSLYKIIT